MRATVSFSASKALFKEVLSLDNFSKFSAASLALASNSALYLASAALRSSSALAAASAAAAASRATLSC